MVPAARPAPADSTTCPRADSDTAPASGPVRRKDSGPGPGQLRFEAASESKSGRAARPPTRSPSRLGGCRLLRVGADRDLQEASESFSGPEPGRRRGASSPQTRMISSRLTAAAVTGSGRTRGWTRTALAGPSSKPARRWHTLLPANSLPSWQGCRLAADCRRAGTRLQSGPRGPGSDPNKRRQQGRGPASAGGAPSAPSRSQSESSGHTISPLRGPLLPTQPPAPGPGPTPPGAALRLPGPAADRMPLRNSDTTRRLKSPGLVRVPLQVRPSFHWTAATLGAAPRLGSGAGPLPPVPVRPSSSESVARAASESLHVARPPGRWDPLLGARRGRTRSEAKFRPWDGPSARRQLPGQPEGLGSMARVRAPPPAQCRPCTGPGRGNPARFDVSGTGRMVLARARSADPHLDSEERLEGAERSVTGSRRAGEPGPSRTLAVRPALRRKPRVRFRVESGPDCRAAARR
jgi:hypothetical protein